jgi:glycosyltransferase involved in cell wall biosynthesis
MADIYLIGVRGIPNRYGGFERLVEVLAPDLVARGHRVTVFCEVDPGETNPADDLWRGVHRRYVATRFKGPLGTIEYDWRSFRAVPAGAVALIFGYGTGTFQRRLRRLGVRHAVNMDGIEWQRAKWGRAARTWLRFNEREAARVADELIADHPEIQSYLQQELQRPSTMIAYGVDEDALQPPSTLPTHSLLQQYSELGYFLVVARPEPENQIHILLAAYAASKRTLPLVVLGNFSANAYGRDLQARHPEAHFAGGVYDARALDALRRRSALYLHGHSVGGTNPSLIEAMAAGALVVAHENRFNRWVLGNKGGKYFTGVDDLQALLDGPSIPMAERHGMVAAARARCQQSFRWVQILGAYSEVVARLGRP